MRTTAPFLVPVFFQKLSFTVKICRKLCPMPKIADTPFRRFAQFCPIDYLISVFDQNKKRPRIAVLSWSYVWWAMTLRKQTDCIPSLSSSMDYLDVYSSVSYALHSFFAALPLLMFLLLMIPFSASLTIVTLLTTLS